MPGPGTLCILSMICRIIDSEGTPYIMLTSFPQPNGLLYYPGGSPLSAVLLTLCGHRACDWGTGLALPVGCPTGQDPGDGDRETAGALTGLGQRA